MADEPEDDTFVAYSYDNLFAVRKVLRRVNDFNIPLRSGLQTNQIGAFFLVFVVTLVLYGMLIAPLLQLLGVKLHFTILLTILFGPAILSAQRVVKPMASGKTIKGTVRSFARFHLDDPVHRRGIPLAASPRHGFSGPVLHFAREWVMATPYSEADPAEQDLTSTNIEARFRGQTDLQRFMDNAAVQHSREWIASQQKRAEEDEANYDYRRGSLAKVHTPFDDEAA